MQIKLRKHLKIKEKCLVVKLSSLALTKESGKIDKKQLSNIFSEVSLLKKNYALKIVVVCSGAVNAGKPYIKNFRPKEMSCLQASAAIGQPILLNAIENELKKHSLKLAQVLLTHEDLKSKKRSLNVRATLMELLENNNIPIINENDGVSFDEITVGDNDQLSAMVAHLLNIKTLIMLTGPNGLFTKDPKFEDAKHISFVNYNQSLNEINLMNKSSAGRGGMRTKVNAIRKLTPLGYDIILASFKNDSPLIASLTSESGTLFLGKKNDLSSHRNDWLRTRVKNDNGVKIDQGALEAILANSSLLPVGIKSILGKFNRGDCIEIIHKRKVVAIGLAEYSHRELEKVKGLRFSEIQKSSTKLPSKSFIHKNNLLIKED